MDKCQIWRLSRGIGVLCCQDDTPLGPADGGMTEVTEAAFQRQRAEGRGQRALSAAHNHICMA
jgi:hypothetical protein